MESKYFKIQQKNTKLSIQLMSKSAANTFGRMNFYSRVLHSLSPDEDRIWRDKERLSVEIKGWPKNIRWIRTGPEQFKGTIKDLRVFDLEGYSVILAEALEGIIEGKSLVQGVKKVHRFSIGNDSLWTEYHFHTKARTIAALCVLYDLAPHGRNDLELNIEKRLGLQEASWPVDYDSKITVRTYGDPSKTADELRNEGWSRMEPDISMKVFRQNIGGAQQQMYQLTQIAQNLDSRVMRTDIPKKWRQKLYKSQDYTCQICHIKYPGKYLAPDHRIPVIYQADDLTEENYKEKLMTLCRFCNQQKRETTKIFPSNYDWGNSPWAFPEKFEIEKIKSEIRQLAKSRKLSIKKALKLLE